MNQNERRQFLIRELLKESDEYKNMQIPSGSVEQKQLLRGMMNIRRPKKITPAFLAVQDEYLQKENTDRGIVDVEKLPEIKKGISVWQGDITSLKCDAIVNAANSGMTGCYVPNHRCIDNCIHSYAGIQLRLECAEFMKKQGYEEPTGRAKITKGYNLPSRYVIHTVGPIIYDHVRIRDEKLLADCYRSCLELAAQKGLGSIAFCCVSTGEFHFPNQKAAEIAVQTVNEFIQKESSITKVIFNVFKDIDKKIYEELLR